MKRTLRDAATVIGGQLVGDDRPYGAVATDSRTLQPGSLFVALRGPTFDGGDFVAAAAVRGAIGAIVERAVPHALPQIVVPDAPASAAALGPRLARPIHHSDRGHRRQQRQDHRQGNDRRDSVGAWVCAWRLTAI